mmetsp:Transcript_113054/g.319904  ORF Transcript_113054/g.319904 Transcript_113054/m.319904 type:complete len:201 (-) Transcript_113054:292-894(-)
MALAADVSSKLPQMVLCNASTALMACSGSGSFPSGPGDAAFSSMSFTQASMCDWSPEKMRWRSSLCRPPSCMNLKRSSGVFKRSSCSCCFFKFSSCCRVASAPFSIWLFRLDIRFSIGIWPSLPGAVLAAWLPRPWKIFSGSRTSGDKFMAFAMSGACLATFFMNSCCISGPPFETALSTSSVARFSKASSPFARAIAMR